MPTETTPAADLTTHRLTTHRLTAGVYSINCGGHGFFVMRDGGRWTIEGLDNRTDDMVKAGVYAGTAYAASDSIVDTFELGAIAPSLKAAKRRIAFHAA